MRLKVILKVLFLVMFITGINSCNEKAEKETEVLEKTKKIGVYNFDNKKELLEYNNLNLDETHPNLLNPEISKANYNSVMKSWTDLHQKIGQYLTENDFSWEVEDTSITIVQKIYFYPDGEIKNYFFNVLNENVTKEKKESYADLISTFAQENRIEFHKVKSFAQCGKTRYLNE